MAVTQKTFEELAWLNAVLDAGIQVFRRNLEDPYRGLYVSDQDADAALAGLPGRDPPEAYVRAVQAFRQRWLALEADATDPLSRLVARAHLGPFEGGALLLCLAPEIDLRYQRIYAYLHDDIAKKAPTVDLALATLCADRELRAREYRLLAPDAPLRALGLLEVLAPDAASPFLAHTLKLTERVRHYLLGGDALGSPLPASTELSGELGAELLAMSDELPEALRRHLVSEDPGWVQLAGEDGFARRRTAQAIAKHLGVKLLAVDCGALVADQRDVADLVRELRCEALIGPALLYWDGLDAAVNPSSPRFASLLAQLRASPGLAVLGTRSSRPLSDGQCRAPLVVEVPALTVSARERLWRAVLEPAPRAESIDYPSLAARYPLDARQIWQAARYAAAQARGEPIGSSQLEQACRVTGAPELGGLAERIEVGYGWSDLVLPEERLAILREICVHARYRGVVEERWGFGQKGSSGRGLSVLFSGPSGTGKTMSAGLIARELGLDIYRIDLARLVSKYIGETEKNIAQVFDATRRSAACLLFDEADAVFAKRSEVKDSHDRFANLETSYLLQRLEQHEGVVFMSTNLRHNIDSAFSRRLSFVIHFSPPDERLRAELWRRAWPAEVPLATDIDPAHLAATHTLNGGNIRNIAFAAAIRACAEGRAVCKADVQRAIAREYEKLGKAWTAGPSGA